jgi:two-component system, NarL family, response regulator LiaR
MAIRLLIADDHAVVREGLRLVLGMDDHIEVLDEEACTGEEAVELARRTHPDVILMDLLMPGMDGTTATRLIHSELPDIAVVALTSTMEDSRDSSVLAAIRAGAVGYLYKTSQVEELRRAVHAAAAGSVELSSAAAKRLVDEVSRPLGEGSLTARETQVLLLVAKGKANKEIARELRIGQQTVKTYVSNILAKLGARSRTEAALHAVQSGLVTKQELSATPAVAAVPPAPRDVRTAGPPVGFRTTATPPSGRGR